MVVMVCLDDNGGMLFNHRRQSQDRVLRDEILRQAGDGKLYVNAYTARQFTAEQQERLVISEDFLAQAGPEDFCFVENVALSPWEDQIRTLILFHWNRVYPTDMSFDIPLIDHGWKLTETREFPGYSHEKITQEVYVK